MCGGWARLCTFHFGSDRSGRRESSECGSGGKPFRTGRSRGSGEGNRCGRRARMRARVSSDHQLGPAIGDRWCTFCCSDHQLGPASGDRWCAFCCSDHQLGGRMANGGGIGSHSETGERSCDGVVLVRLLLLLLLLRWRWQCVASTRSVGFLLLCQLQCVTGIRSVGVLFLLTAVVRRHDRDVRNRRLATT